MANKNITQLTQQTGSADTTSLFYTVTGIPGNFSDKSLPFAVLVNNLGLTGVPTTPTAAVDTNTIQIASTAFVIGQGYLKSTTAASTYAPLASPTFTGTIGGGSASINLGGVASFASIQSTPIGTTTSAAGTFTTLTANTSLVVNGTLSGAGVSTYLASPPSIGSTTPASGAFTTLSASSTVSGAGFSTYLASPPAIGSTTANTGRFTTLTATSTITPSSTAGIVGTTTNDNANAGSIGEYFSPTGAGTGLTSGTYVDLSTQSLTAGDWDIEGTVNFNGSSLAASVVVVGINTVANTQPSGTAGASQFLTFSSGVLTGATMCTPVVRMSLSTTTTVRLGGSMTFSAGTVTATGTLRARRVR